MKKRLILCMLTLAGLMVPGVQAKDLVVYFSATGNTQAVAEEIARLTGTVYLVSLLNGKNRRLGSRKVVL